MWTTRSISSGLVGSATGVPMSACSSGPRTPLSSRGERFQLRRRHRGVRADLAALDPDVVRRARRAARSSRRALAVSGIGGASSTPPCRPPRVGEQLVRPPLREVEFSFARARARRCGRGRTSGSPACPPRRPPPACCRRAVLTSGRPAAYATSISASGPTSIGRVLVAVAGGLRPVVLALRAASSPSMGGQLGELDAAPGRRRAGACPRRRVVVVRVLRVDPDLVRGRPSARRRGCRRRWRRAGRARSYGSWLFVVEDAPRQVVADALPDRGEVEVERRDGEQVGHHDVVDELLAPVIWPLVVLDLLDASGAACMPPGS